MVTLEDLEENIHGLKKDVAIIKNDVKWFKMIIKWVVVGILALLGVQVPGWM